MGLTIRDDAPNDRTSAVPVPLVAPSGAPPRIPTDILNALTAPPHDGPVAPELGSAALLVCPHCNLPIHIQLSACHVSFGADLPSLTDERDEDAILEPEE